MKTYIVAFLICASATTTFSIVFYAMLSYGVTRIKSFAHIAMALAFPSLVFLMIAADYLKTKVVL